MKSRAPTDQEILDQIEYSCTAKNAPATFEEIMLNMDREHDRHVLSRIRALGREGRVLRTKREPLAYYVKGWAQYSGDGGQ